MSSGQQIEEVKAWTNLPAAAAPAVQDLNSYVVTLGVNPALPRRTIWAWCNTCTVIDAANEGYQCEFEVRLFKQSQIIGVLTFGHDDDDFPAPYYPEVSDKVTWEHSESPDAMIFRRFWSQSAGTTYKQSRFAVAPVRLISDCDSIRLFVRSYKSRLTAMNFLTGLRVISHRL